MAATALLALLWSMECADRTLTSCSQPTRRRNLRTDRQRGRRVTRGLTVGQDADCTEALAVHPMRSISRHGTRAARARGAGTAERVDQGLHHDASHITHEGLSRLERRLLNPLTFFRELFRQVVP